MGRRAVRGVLTTVLVTAVVVALVGGLLWWAQRRLIYFPDRTAVPAAETVIPGAREVRLDTSDGLRLGAWLVPPAGPDRAVAVLVAPGNGGNRMHRVPLARALSGIGLTVLLLEYRGYGGNPGNPSEEGLARDVRAAHAYLTGSAGFPPSRVIYFGESLGGGVVTGLAVDHPPGGLVLRSPFTELADAGRHHYPLLPVHALLRDRFPVAALISRVDAPTVVIYGPADTIIPAGQSRRVAEQARDLVRLVAVPDAGHNDAALVHGPLVIEAVAELAERVARRSQ